MIRRLRIQNFRSIEEADLELGRLVLLYGPTASGKSSVLYAPLVLRNFIVDPNRPADGYFHLGFMDLAGFEASVFNHDKERAVAICVYTADDRGSGSYGVAFSRNTAKIQETWQDVKLECEVPLPYGLNQNFSFSHTAEGQEYAINWNGVASTVSPKLSTPVTEQTAREFATALNAIPETIRAIDMAPHRRGFFRPNYTVVPVSPTPTTEDEVAALIINDQNLAPRISAYLEEMVRRDFRLYTPPGTATVFFQTTDKISRTPGLLVNDGFGVNQMIYLLAKILRPDVQTVLIEEPEIHLHPTAMREFARRLGEIATHERKQMFFTTHSEMFVSSLLAAVAEGRIAAEDLRCYLCEKQGRATSVKLQTVKPNGQIDGGLKAFVESEIEDLKGMLRL